MISQVSQGNRAKSKGVQVRNTSTGLFSDALVEKTLLAAIEIWESLRSTKLKDDQKISIFETQAHSYAALQQALVAQNKNEKALEIAE